LCPQYGVTTSRLRGLGVAGAPHDIIGGSQKAVMGIHSDTRGVWLMHDASSNQNCGPPVFSSHDLETGPMCHSLASLPLCARPGLSHLRNNHRWVVGHAESRFPSLPECAELGLVPVSLVRRATASRILHLAHPVGERRQPARDHHRLPGRCEFPSICAGRGVRGRAGLGKQSSVLRVAETNPARDPKHCWESTRVNVI
jgi:hypothetical protein